MANFVEIEHGGIFETVNTDSIDRMFPPKFHDKNSVNHFCVKVLFNDGNEVDYIFLPDEVGKREAQALYDKLRGKKEDDLGYVTTLNGIAVSHKDLSNITPEEIEKSTKIANCTHSYKDYHGETKYLWVCSECTHSIENDCLKHRHFISEEPTTPEPKESFSGCNECGYYEVYCSSRYKGNKEVYGYLCPKCNNFEEHEKEPTTPEPETVESKCNEFAIGDESVLYKMLLGPDTPKWVLQKKLDQIRDVIIELDQDSLSDEWEPLDNALTKIKAILEDKSDE